MTSAHNPDIDLLILGAGPVGLTAAVEAHRLGLSARIIDRKAARSANDSRALVLHPRVMELLQPALAEQIQQASFRNQQLNIHLSKETVLKGVLDEARWGDTEYPFISFLPQYETERILEQEVVSTGRKVEYGLSVEDLIQTENAVTVTLCHDASKQKETVTAKYVIGCDGGRSKTRELLGVEMHRSESKVYFFVGDVHFSQCPVADKRVHVFPTKKGGLALFPLPANHTFRLLLQCPDNMTDKKGADFDKTFIEDQLVDRTELPFQIETLSWKNVFEITHGISETFRKGRVFLAGDAGHVHSPVGGQGMNYGMADAHNLVWKLAWAERCAEKFPKAKDSLNQILDSYNDERHSLGTTLINVVERATLVITTRNRLLQMARNLFIRLLFPFINKDAFRTVGQLELKYDPSWSKIIVSPASYWDSFVCAPGTRLPNLRLLDGSHLHSHMDRVHHTWVFLNNEGPKITLGGLKAVSVTPAPEQDSIPVIGSTTLMKPQVILVRPDLFVCGVAATDKAIWDHLNEELGSEALSTM